MQQSCQVCNKPVNYERGAVEVACPYCYTEYRIDGMGRLKMVDLFEEESLAVDDDPRAGTSDRETDDMARLLDDGADQHITFVKDTGDARPKKGTGKTKATPTPAPTGDIGSLEFADDDEPGRGPTSSGPTFADLTGGGGGTGPQARRKKKKKKRKPSAGSGRKAPSDAQAVAEALARERGGGRPGQRKGKKRKGAKRPDLANHPDPLQIPEDMRVEPDTNQRALVGLVVAIVGVILFGGLTAVGVIMFTGSGGDDDRRSRRAATDSEPDGGSATGVGSAGADNAAGPDGMGLNEVVAKAEEFLNAGSYADAREAVIWLETASESGELNSGQRRRLDHTLGMAQQACDAWRLYEQGVAAIERAEATTDPLRAKYERHFALDMLREASSATRRGTGFIALREKITAATARAREE